IEDVTHRGGAKAVDGLGVITDDRETFALWGKAKQDLRLQRVGVLVFVDEDMVEASSHPLRIEGQPIQKQIVIVERVGALLRVDIGGEELLQFVAPGGAPGKLLLQRGLQRLLGIDHSRVDGKTRPLLRKALLRSRKSKIVPQDIQQIGRVGAIEN